MTAVEADLIERPMPHAGIRGLTGLAYGQIAVGTAVFLVLLVVAMSHNDASTLIACAVGASVVGVLFLVPFGKDRLIVLIPRWVAFVYEWVACRVDVHTRNVEGRHYTHRPLPDATPLSPHFGAMWLSTFDWHDQPVGLLIEGGSWWQPWRSAHMIVVQVSGQDQLLLESPNYQEILLRRWTAMLNTQLKRSLGLTGIQELLITRPMIQGEGAHWQSFNAVKRGQNPRLVAQYQAVQLAHDAVTVDRRMFLTLRTGGTFSSWMRARRRGSSRAGIEDHFRGVLDKLGGVAYQATLTVQEVLSADRAAAELRLMVDPASAPAVGYRRGARQVRTVPTQVAPITHWKAHVDRVEVNGMVARTFRTVGWPDTVVGSSLLAGVLDGFEGSLRVGIPIGPEDPKIARKANKVAMTWSQANLQHKTDQNQVVTEDDKMAEEKARQRDAERARGKHHPAIYNAYFTLLADGVDAAAVALLDRFSEELMTQLDTASVDIQCCYGFQGPALRYTLPFCQGLR